MQVLDLVIVTDKGVLGDEDAFIESENHRYSTSCECISENAEVFEIRAEDFFKQARALPNWHEIASLIQDKLDKFVNRVVHKNQVEKIVDQSLKHVN